MVNMQRIAELEPHWYRLTDSAISGLEQHVEEHASHHPELNDLKIVLWGSLALIRQNTADLSENDLVELVHLAAKTGFYVGELIAVEDLAEQYPNSPGGQLYGALALAFRTELDKAIRLVQLQSTGNDSFLKAEKLAVLSYLHSIRRELHPLMRYLREIEILLRKDPFIRTHVLPLVIIRKNYLLRSEKSLRKRATSELEELLRSLSTVGHRFYLSKAHLRLGQLYFNQNHFEEAFFHYDQALELAQALDAQHLLSIIYNRIGMWYLTQARWNNAKESFETALAHACNCNAEWLTAAPLVNLSQFMWINNRQEDAIQAVETFRKIAEKVGDPYDRLTAYNILSQMHEVLGNIELSRQYLRKAMSLVTELERDGS